MLYSIIFYVPTKYPIQINLILKYYALIIYEICDNIEKYIANTYFLVQEVTKENQELMRQALEEVCITWPSNLHYYILTF